MGGRGVPKMCSFLNLDSIVVAVGWVVEWGEGARHLTSELDFHGAGERSGTPLLRPRPQGLAEDLRKGMDMKPSVARVKDRGGYVGWSVWKRRIDEFTFHRARRRPARG